MELHILGSGGYHPSSKRHTLCSVIPEAGLILDAGTAFFRLARFLDGKPWNIFLTHAHLDHVVGLTYYWGLAQQREIGPMSVWGGDTALRAVKELLFSQPLFPKVPPYEFIPVSPGESVVITTQRAGYESVSVIPVPLSHPGGALGYRFQIGGRSVAYITDTTLEALPVYGAVIQDVDLLIHEAFYPSGYEEMAQKTGHVTVAQAAEVARQVGAKRLVIAHLNPIVDCDGEKEQHEVACIFSNTIIATDNLVVEI